jgi:hypothetical protein
MTSRSDSPKDVAIALGFVEPFHGLGGRLDAEVALATGPVATLLALRGRGRFRWKVNLPRDVLDRRLLEAFRVASRSGTSTGERRSR